MLDDGELKLSDLMKETVCRDACRAARPSNIAAISATHGNVSEYHTCLPRRSSRTIPA